MRSLALSMIVRNAEEHLPRCLESVRGIVDEMVIADTGSSDRTVEIAQSAGARVISVTWEDDFAQARNLALAEVTSDWVLVLDADERLDATAVSLRQVIQEAKCAGFQVRIRNYVGSMSDRVWDRAAMPNDFLIPESAPYPGFVEHENVRLFRRDPAIWFVGRVHETVGPRIQQTGGKLGRAEFVIHHFGLVDRQEVRARKAHFYRELGRKKVAEMPNDAQAHFELGLVEFDNFHSYETALQCFRRSCELNPAFATAQFFAALALQRVNRHRESLDYLQRAEALGHSPGLLHEARGDALYSLGEFAGAQEAYRRALSCALPPAAELRGKLGLAQVRAGKVESGLEQMRRAIESNRRAAENYDRLISAYVWLDRLLDAAMVCERKLEMVAPEPRHYIRAAAIRARLGQWDRAAETLRDGLRKFPDCAELQAVLGEIRKQEAAAAAPLPEGMAAPIALKAAHRG